MIVLAAFMYMRCSFKGVDTSTIAGAVLFSTALCGILSFKLNLYTGAIGYLGSTKGTFECILILLGNILATLLVGLVLSFALTSEASLISLFWVKKLTNFSVYNTLVKSMACGILMYLAVEGWKHNNKFLTIFSVATFLLAGFEHSVANTAFLGLSITTLLYEPELLVEVIGLTLWSYVGNTLGAIAFRLVLDTDKKPIVNN